MEPASGSSDDESSIEQVSSRQRIPRNDDDSSSAPSSSDDDDNDSDDDDEGVQKFDDLPSEDSCLEEDSDEENDNEEDEDDTPLSERIYANQNNGKQSKSKAVANKKSKALEIAQKRLSEMKKKRKQADSDSDDDDDDDDSDDSEDEFETSKKKKSKHAPTVASSSRSDFYKRGAPDLNSSGIGVEIGANKYKPRDPRMQSLSGHFDQNVFEKRYDFLETMQDGEIEKMKLKLKAWKVTGKKGQKQRKKLGMIGGDTTAEDVEEELKRLMQERASRRDAKMRSAAKSTVKKKMRDDVAEGKRGAYYLKKKDMKKLELEAKFDQLRKVGGDSAVNKVLQKRRKRKMGKDSGLMPKA